MTQAAPNLELVPFERVVAEAEAEVAAARQKVAQAEHRVAATKKEREALDKHWQDRIASRGEGVKGARLELGRAIAEVGKRALADEANFGADLSTTRVEIAAATRMAEDARLVVAKHEKAIQAYDRPTYLRGLVIMVAASALVALAVVVPILIKIFGSSGED
jgi:hypothetical protein